jgi:hypothetical protein
MSWLLVSAQDWNALMAKVDAIAASVARIDQTTKASRYAEDQMAKTLDDVLDDITDLGSKEDGLVTLVKALKASVDEAVKGTVTPEQQAKIDQAFAAVEARKTAIQQAIDENTPPSPPADPNAPHPDTEPVGDQPTLNPLSQKRT